MPYRRLPNTDTARLRALQRAFAKGEAISPIRLAFSQANYYRLQKFLPVYESAMQKFREVFSARTEDHTEYMKKVRKARMYITHFIKVANMTVLRGDMNASTLSFFGLPETGKKVPLLNSENSIIKWGDMVTKGEKQRIMKGLTPLANPTGALVTVHYQKFLEAYKHQQLLKEKVNDASKVLDQLKKDADDIILSIGNEVEETYAGLLELERLQRCTDYGVVYFYRKNELQKIGNFPNLSESLISEDNLIQQDEGNTTAGLESSHER